MGLAWKVIVLFALLNAAVCAAEYDYPDYPSGGGSTEYIEVASVLENFRPHIIKVYGSAERAEKFWKRRNDDVVHHAKCGLDRAWAVDDLRLTIESQEPGTTLYKSVYDDLLNAVNTDIDNLLKDTDEGYDACNKYFSDLRESRKHLDCALGREVVTDIFTNMEPPQQCWEKEENYTRGLWIRVANAPDFSKKCNELGVYNDVVRIAQISVGRSVSGVWDTASELSRMEMMADLALTLSRRDHLEYLTRIQCGEKIQPWHCQQIVNAVGSAVCGPLTLETVLNIERLVKGESLRNPLSSPQDMFITMKILNTVTKTVEKLSKTTIIGATRAASKNTLDSYMDVVDSAIGKSAQHIWTEMPDDESREMLQMVLANNEQYVGAMSSIYFNSPGGLLTEDSLNKEAIELKLFRVPRENATDNVAFEFLEAKIETKFPAEEVASGLNVYAIHYKSWAELLQREVLEVNSTNNQTKRFVGNGGIISLSAYAEEGKKTIPVTYKMNFDKVASDDPNAGSSMCLSCEYLNIATGEWEDHGCEVETVDGDGVKCSCNHTTNFAAFMSPVPINMDLTPAQYQAKQIVSYVGSAVSVLALAISLIIFNIVRPTIRNDRLKAHMNLAFALFVVHLVQLTVDFAVKINSACIMAAVATHFFLLAAFFWMLIEGIFLYLYVVQVFVHSTIEYLRVVYILGWLLPAVIVAISAGIGIPTNTYLDVIESPCGDGEFLYPPQAKYEQCWLSAKSGMSWSFIAPALLIIIINSVILAKVFQVLMKVSGKSRNIRPFQPPTSSSGNKKDPASVFVNRTYGQKESGSPAKYKTTEGMTKTPKDVEANYGATAKGQPAGNAGGSPGRFDGRVPSQAYMYNRTQSTKQSPGHDNSNGKHFVEDVKAAIKGAVVLLPILGIPWICGLWIGNNYALMMIFILLNSTQGLVIFIVYCLMNGEVRRALQRHMKVAKLRSQTGRSRSSSTSSLRSLNSRFVRSWRTKSGSEPPSK